MIIDAKHQIVGRVASIAAKKALLGETVFIINCDLAIVTGSKENVMASYERKRQMGTFKGPFYIRKSDRLVRRIIRGMLPYKQPKGAAAYKRVRCYNGVPEKFINQKMETLTKTSIDKLPNFKYVTMQEISKHLGGKL